MNTDSGARLRDADKGWLTRWWDWIDNRDIDKHVISILILLGSWHITTWAMQFAHASIRPGLEVAAIIAAIGGPWAAVQGVAIGFHFKARA